MNIEITQDNSRTELLGFNGAQVIRKIYLLATDLNNTVNFVGRIDSPTGYANEVDYLNNKFDNLTINTTKNYITFEDPNAEKVCAVFFGDGIGVTATDMANAVFGDNNKHDISINGLNLTNVSYGEAFRLAGVVKFNEFRYFTQITSTGDSWWNNDKLWGLGQNPTILEITLPPGLVEWRVGAYPNNMSPDTLYIHINNSTLLQYIDNMSNKIADGDNSFDFSKVYGDYSMNGWSYSILSYAAQEFAILPKSSVITWDSTKQFHCVIRRNAGGIKTVICQEDFVCNEFYVRGYGRNGYNIPENNYLENLVFLSTSQPYQSLNSGYNVDTFKIYVPDSAINTYGDATLSLFANKSEANKLLLESVGCTVTGASLGNYVVKAPGEA